MGAAAVPLAINAGSAIVGGLMGGGRKKTEVTPLPYRDVTMTRADGSTFPVRVYDKIAGTSEKPVSPIGDAIMGGGSLAGEMYGLDSAFKKYRNPSAPAGGTWT
jgi:hypothetical protein